MNRLMKSAAGLMLACAAFTFSSCEDDSNIIGLNDATKYGFIKVTWEGTRPDGEPYSVTRNFRFTSSTGPEYSSTVDTGLDGDIYRDFDVIRFAGAINESGEGENNYVYLEINTQEGDEIFTSADFQLNAPVTTDDKKFFYIYENIEVENEDVTSYKYNEETGKLSYKFTKELTADETNSGYPLTVTVNANVTVFERINSVGF
jgi:hypothetical protein